MSYNTKNYTEQGGDITHFGGRVIFEEGVSLEGDIPFEMPRATTEDLGGVIVGDGISVDDDGVISTRTTCHFTFDEETEEWECDTDPQTLVNAFDDEQDVVGYIVFPGGSPTPNKAKVTLEFVSRGSTGLWLEMGAGYDNNCYVKYRNGTWTVQLPE